MRILITNDDGIEASGLIRLALAAQKFGEVWVVAPDGQRSAASHAISLHNSFDVYKHDFPVEGVRTFTCSGTPADCVRVGSLSIMPEKPDAVLSGINFGYNLATDIQYSGTAGAAFEGAFQGFLSAAFSEEAKACHETSDAFLHTLLSEIFAEKPPYGCIYNINIPGCPVDECRGVLRDRRVSRGMIYRDHYIVLEQLKDGGVRYMVEGDYNEDAEPDTDFRAVLDGYISVSVVENIKG